MVVPEELPAWRRFAEILPAREQRFYLSQGLLALRGPPCKGHIKRAPAKKSEQACFSSSMLHLRLFRFYGTFFRLFEGTISNAQAILFGQRFRLKPSVFWG